MNERNLASRRLRRGAAAIGALALTVGLAALGGGTASASAAHSAPAAKHHHKPQPHGRFGIVPMRSASTASTASRVHAFAPRAGGTGGPLNYGGGPVQHNVQVYLVFWGSQWDSDANGVESYMQNLFGGLGTGSDSWSTVTSQYTDNSGGHPTFGNGAVLAGTWVDNASPAPQSAAQADIAAEAENGVSHFGVSPSTDVQIVVLSPSGTNPDGFPNTGFCAWHDFDGSVPYTNMPYVLDAGSGCGANSVSGQLDGFSIVEGHEYAETLTDPQPSSGWVASDGEENGDLCAWYNMGTISLSTGTFAMQPTWSNAVNGCAMSG